MTGKVQYIFIVGVMFLVSQLTLRLNSSVLQAKVLGTENESVLAATSFAQAFLHEVTARHFDERVIGKKITTVDSLTVPASLGPETGETYSTFDDIDDFNGYVRTAINDRLGTDTLRVAVSYTNKTSVGTTSSARTFMKSIAVTISGPYLPKTITMRTVVSY